jgi:hypothetical protein
MIESDTNNWISRYAKESKIVKATTTLKDYFELKTQTESKKNSRKLTFLEQKIRNER